ncbi:NIPSNAP family protein [Phyllobacterium endophyticum]|uniref:NIPSNAP family protein n=2 Tax=Phyllobacterium endophyticum TaxID=1149773 RepID=A0A2P7ASB9_9HYPH|nr:NIPSNAP family protein [Phyllobacterium endophyticum]TYR40350.1 NIPSNAP family protein [Phyllobacterium endophyticum]
MIGEQRMNRIKSGRLACCLKLVRQEGLAIQQPILANPIGCFTTETGTLNQGNHLWGYSDFEHRMRRRKILAEDTRWPAFFPRLTQNIAGLATGFFANEREEFRMNDAVTKLRV